MVDSKSQSGGYNYLDACQAIDGLWVVGQVPSWPFYGQVPSQLQPIPPYQHNSPGEAYAASGWICVDERGIDRAVCPPWPDGLSVSVKSEKVPIRSCQVQNLVPNGMGICFA